MDPRHEVLAPEASTRRRLLIWDAPNVDMRIGEILGRKPTGTERPDMAAVAAWFASQGMEGEALEATVFLNVAGTSNGGLRNWIAFLTLQGFDVFAKPKVGDSDVDLDMVAHLERRRGEGGLRAVVVASHDSKRFLRPLTETVASGVAVTVLGFPECAGQLAAAEDLSFVDLEEVSGAFKHPLPRVNLRALPDEGRWFAARERIPPMRVGQAA